MAENRKQPGLRFEDIMGMRAQYMAKTGQKPDNPSPHGPFRNPTQAAASRRIPPPEQRAIPQEGEGEMPPEDQRSVEPTKAMYLRKLPPAIAALAVQYGRI